MKNDLLKITPEKAADQLMGFIKSEFAKAGFSRAVIGLSGGVDSAVSLVLGIRALGGENVYPALLPYGALSTQGTLDAMSFIQSQKIPLTHICRIDIKPAVDEMCMKTAAADNVRRGNIMARVRMTYLFDQAKKHEALVLGTENKSEQLLGYFTRFGDEASDIEPLINLYKTQVFELAAYLGVPEQILTKKPTAGLWADQTDEGEFGFSYRDADGILTLLYDLKKSIDEVVSAGFDRGLVEKVKTRVEANNFKHHLPIISPGT